MYPKQNLIINVSLKWCASSYNLYQWWCFRSVWSAVKMSAGIISLFLFLKIWRKWIFRRKKINFYGWIWIESASFQIWVLHKFHVLMIFWSKLCGKRLQEATIWGWLTIKRGKNEREGEREQAQRHRIDYIISHFIIVRRVDKLKQRLRSRTNICVCLMLTRKTNNKSTKSSACWTKDG